MNTIHIFGYGEAQIIGQDLNYKTDVANLKTLQAVIDDIKSKKPVDIEAMDYHVINIFNNLRCDYLPKSNGQGIPVNMTDLKRGMFSVEFKDIDSKKLNALIAEFGKLKVAADKEAAKTPA